MNIVMAVRKRMQGSGAHNIMTHKIRLMRTVPAPDPVVSDPLEAYALPSQVTDGLAALDIDPRNAVLTVFGDLRLK